MAETSLYAGRRELFEAVLCMFGSFAWEPHSTMAYFHNGERDLGKITVGSETSDQLKTHMSHLDALLKPSAQSNDLQQRSQLPYPPQDHQEELLQNLPQMPYSHSSPEGEVPQCAICRTISYEGCCCMLDGSLAFRCGQLLIDCRRKELARISNQVREAMKFSCDDVHKVSGTKDGGKAKTTLTVAAIEGGLTAKARKQGRSKRAGGGGGAPEPAASGGAPEVRPRSQNGPPLVCI